MIEEVFSCTCPIHGHVLTTKIKKTFKRKSSKEVYEKPFFYCDFCKAHYMFFEEHPSTYHVKKTLKDGSLLHIYGKQIESVSSEKDILYKEKLEIGGTNRSDSDSSNSEINKYTEDNPLEINIVKTGRKLPKKCLNCGADTESLTLLFKEGAKKEKKLIGKKCCKCGEIYYSETIYQAHIDFFRPKRRKRKPEPEAKIGETISNVAKTKISRYLKAKSNFSIQNLRKELIETDEDIDSYLQDLLLKGTKDQRERILYVGIRRAPQMFFYSYWKKYGNDSKRIEELDFKNKEYRVAAIDLIGVISPYPSILLAKLSDDNEAQLRIRDEVKKGNINLSYIKYLSKNKNIIFEECIQHIICGEINKQMTEDYYPFLNLNSDEGINILNREIDLAIIYHILDKNIWGINSQTIPKIKAHVLSVQSALREGLIDETVQQYFNSIEVSTTIIDHAKDNEIYVGWMFGLAGLKKDLSLLENIYIFFDKNGINVTNYENLLASYGSNHVLHSWLDRIKCVDLTQKHVLAKKILLNYRDKAPLLFKVVEESRHEKYILNVKKMAEDLEIEWFIENIYENKKINTIKTNSIFEFQKEDKNTRQKTRTGKYFDDFGIEYDFSNLDNILLL